MKIIIYFFFNLVFYIYNLFKSKVIDYECKCGKNLKIHLTNNSGMSFCDCGATVYVN